METISSLARFQHGSRYVLVRWPCHIIPVHACAQVVAYTRASEAIPAFSGRATEVLVDRDVPADGVGSGDKWLKVSAAQCTCIDGKRRTMPSMRCD